LLAVRNTEGAIVGLLTLVVFRLATGIRALIEDVVVDSAHRRLGIGDALVRDAVELATELRARTIELTSRPERAEANRLYRRLGFELRETNAYRLTLAP
jgi:ribosomal protein S18 acetylase RimI-like enzyme